MPEFYTCSNCKAEWPLRKNFTVPNGVDECVLCDRECCEDCWVLVINSKGENRHVCEGCRDDLYKSVQHATVLRRLQQIQSTLNPLGVAL